MAHFARHLTNQTTTGNDMPAVKSSLSSVVDFFYQVGSYRSGEKYYSRIAVDNNEIVRLFLESYNCDRNLTGKILAWSRDPRYGAGSRDAFRTILAYLADNHPEDAKLLIDAIGEIGRWDDAIKALAHLSPKHPVFIHAAMNAWAAVLMHDRLAAKWMPRKGKLAAKIRAALGHGGVNVTPKHYRKTIVANTEVVETQMCEQQWNKIEYQHVPSLAFARYRCAFRKHDKARFDDFLKAVENKEAKIHASAVYPHDVLKNTINNSLFDNSTPEDDAINLQWEELVRTYTSNLAVLPVVDLSESMFPCNRQRTGPIHVAVALGVLMANKLQGHWHNVICGFSHKAVSTKLPDDTGVCRQLRHLFKSIAPSWGMNTNIEALFEFVLDTAAKYSIPKEQMPKSIVIFSNTQFDQCVDYPDAGALDMIKRRYDEAGYELPKIAFWNLNGYKNMPVTVNEHAILFSGMSNANVDTLLDILEQIRDGIDINMENIIRQIINKRKEWDIWT